MNFQHHKEFSKLVKMLSIKLWQECIHFPSHNTEKQQTVDHTADRLLYFEVMLNTE